MNCNGSIQNAKENSHCFILSTENLLPHCIPVTGSNGGVAAIVRRVKRRKLNADCRFIFEIFLYEFAKRYDYASVRIYRVGCLNGNA